MKAIRWVMAVISFSVGEAAFEVVASSSTNGWTKYETIMWTSDSAYRKPDKVPLFFQRLREMGITRGMVHNDGNLKPLIDNQFPYYVENVVNRGLCLKFNSKVTDWDKFVTDWAKSGRPVEALKRDYTLDDPEWLKYATAQMRDLVRKNKANHPLAYDIRDELSITISANPFDYDFNPTTLGNFRRWLQTQYPDLLTLNKQWETKFQAWEEVMPFTTDEIKNRMASGDAIPRGKPDWQALQRVKFDPAEARKNPTQWNFSPWADFRTFMDITLANALGEIRQAGKEEDPTAIIGIEGTQMPAAFGGYDLQRLSEQLDWIEPYDIGNARDIFGSFMAGKPIVTTVFEQDTQQASRRLWHLLLEGDRGCIIWWSEDCIDWNSADYQLTSKGKALAPVLKELTSQLGEVFLRAKKEVDPIYIHYSHPSVQVDWLLESTVDGSTWLRRFSSYEAEHNRMAKVRNSWLKLFQDAGFTPQFISYDKLGTNKGFEKNAVLILPQSYALSDEEIKGLTRFGSTAGNSVLADGSPGLFDQHGKLRTQSPLDQVFPPALSSRKVYMSASGTRQEFALDISRYGVERMTANPAPFEQFRQAIPIKAPVSYQFKNKTRVHRYQLGKAKLLAFERNISYQMSEDLKQKGGNELLETDIEEAVQLEVPAHIYDLRTGKYLGESKEIFFTLQPWQPSIFALMPDPLPPGANLVQELLKPAK